MKLLAIETAVAPGSLAVAEGGAGLPTNLRSVELPPERRTAQTLTPAVAQLLQAVGWQANQLDVVAVTVGPGSFTGLRIGVTTAKTLAYASGAKCAPVSTLAAIGAQVEEPSADGWAVLDAHRRQLFAARLSAVEKVAIVDEQQWLAGLSPGETVTGPVLEKLAAKLPEDVIVADQSLWAPSAETVAKLALASSTRVTPFELAPDYYRLSAAEEKLQSKG